MKKTVSTTQLILTVLYVVAFIVSNVITSKQMLMPFGLTMTGAIIIFPITYILSDLFSEVYGYKWSRITCYLAFAANIFMVVTFQIAISTPAPSYWGNQEAFQTVLGNTPRILIASMLAFIFGDYINDNVFSEMKKKKSGMDGFAGRAILSSLFGEIVDSIIFVPLAFLGEMPFKTLVIMIGSQVLLKTAYEVVILPVTTIITRKVLKIENDTARTA